MIRKIFVQYIQEHRNVPLVQEYIALMEQLSLYRYEETDIEDFSPLCMT